MIIHPALQFEFDRIETRFESAFKRLQDLSTYDEGRYVEVIYRILSCRVDILYSVLGAFSQYGYHHEWDGGPLTRMEFLVHFVAHELLDDGDPGIGWHKYNMKEGIKEPCLENDRKGEPYLHRCHEILPPGSKWADEETTIWVLDWHEKKEEERYKFYNETRKPEDPMLIELAKSITGR